MQKQTQISTNPRLVNEINKLDEEIEELKKKIRHLKKQKLQLLKNLHPAKTDFLKYNKDKDI